MNYYLSKNFLTNQTVKPIKTKIFHIDIIIK
jgi:hypothetical protein